MTCQMLFSRKNKENIIRLLPADFAHSMLSIKIIFRIAESGLISGVVFTLLLLNTPCLS